MDNIMENVGEFGKYQKYVLVVVGLLSALSSATIYATIFTAAEPDFTCVHLNSSLNSSSSVSVENDTCKIWSMIMANASQAVDYNCSFDLTFYSKTIINEWSLVCDKYYLAGLTQTIQMLGSMFGFFGGIIGDRYGRRFSTLLFAVVLTVTLLSSQFLLIPGFDYAADYKYVIYSVSQFMIGLLVNCMYCTAYILLMELTTERYRTKLTNLNSYMYVGGELVVLVVYYYSRSWHVVNWFLGFTSLFLLVFSYFFLPESPAFFISMGRNDEALRELNKIAKFNGRKPMSLEASYFDSIKEQEELLNDNDEDQSSLPARSDFKEETSNRKQPLEARSLWQKIDGMFMLTALFTPRKVLIKTSILFYIWTALLLLYYGISLGVTEEAEHADPYLMYLLGCIAETLGFVCCYLNDLFGRKKTINGFFLVTTVIYAFLAYLNFNKEVNLSEGYSPRVILLMCLAFLGKCMASGAYNMSYIYTSELYPTSTRSTAIIFLSCVGSLASILAPQVNMLKILVWAPLPYLIYSGCALFAAFSIFYLPGRLTK